jgi:hypothetical protein
MSNLALSGAICWEAETAGAYNPATLTGWAEPVDTWATDRVAVLESIDISGLTHDVLAPNRVTQYRNDGTPYILGVKGGSFKTKMYWTGHGSTMVGSPTINARENFIARAFGVAAALSATSSTTLTGGTAAVPTTTASGTFSAGSLCRIGALGDGDGDGQMYPVTTHTTTTLTLRGALNGAPVNGAVLYPVVQYAIPESPTGGAISGTRFLIQTANHQVKVRGAFPMQIVISGQNPGELPTIEITWGVSWWDYTSQTFPSTTSSAAAFFNPATTTNGSLNLQLVGTTTRALRDYRGLTITHTLGIVPREGPGGANLGQKIIGATRVPDDIQVEWTEDADAASATPGVPSLSLTSFYHIEFTGSSADGSAYGWAMPKACLMNRPTQRNEGGINVISPRFKAHTSTVTTSALTLAAIVYGEA